MIILAYFNWSGTQEELSEYLAESKKHWDKIKGVTYKGCYVTTSAWNRVSMYETESFEKWMENMPPGWREKIPLASVEILI